MLGDALPHHRLHKEHHEFVVCMLLGFPIMRPLALTLFGFLQSPLLTADEIIILATDVVYIHAEFVRGQITLSPMI